MSAPDAPATSHLIEMVADELGDFVHLVGSLTEDQWSQASWCEGWTVRDVVIHVADHVHRSSLDAVRALVAGGLSPAKGAERTVQRRRGLSADELVAWLGAPVREPSLVQLAELMIHQQDVRRPLGITREIPAARLVTCLDFCLSRKGSVAVSNARRRIAGLRLWATDVAWMSGAGDEVAGPAEALMMAVNGRARATADLTGAGVATLGGR